MKVFVSALACELVHAEMLGAAVTSEVFTDASPEGDGGMEVRHSRRPKLTPSV
jgi:hypothetical protein